MDERDILTERIIGCAVALHRSVGPGLSEKVYQRGLAIEFEFNGLRFKDRPAFDRVFEAQILTYLRVSQLRRGLLLNFGRPLMKDGIQRYVLG